MRCIFLSYYFHHCLFVTILKLTSITAIRLKNGAVKVGKWLLKRKWDCGCIVSWQFDNFHCLSFFLDIFSSLNNKILLVTCYRKVCVRLSTFTWLHLYCFFFAYFFHVIRWILPFICIYLYVHLNFMQ